MMQIKKYINKNNLILNNKKELKIKIWNEFKNKKSFYPDNKINNLREKYYIKNNRKIVKLEYDKNKKIKSAIRFIISIRLGEIEYKKSLIRRKLIKEMYINKCLCCEEENEDDFIHWLLECKRFNSEKDTYIYEIYNIFGAIEPENYQLAFLSHILKGEFKHKVPKKLSKKYSKKITLFINFIMVEREFKIKKLIAIKSSKLIIDCNTVKKMATVLMKRIILVV